MTAARDLPAGGAAEAVEEPAIAGAPGGRPRGRRAIDPMASWRKHGAKLPLTLAVVFAVGFPLFWLKGNPRYYAETAVRVAPTYVKNLQDEADIQLASTTQYLLFVQQQVTTIRSFDVALGALRRLKDRGRIWQEEGESDRHAAERLMAAITVRPIKDTYLVTIGLEGDRPDGLDQIVNAVAGAYLDLASEEGLYGSDLRIRSLADRRAELQRKIDESVEKVAGIARDIGVSTFEDTQLNPFDSALVATREALAVATRARIAAESRHQALAEAQRREDALEVESAARETLERNQAVASATKLYHDRRAVLLGQLSGLSAGHPGYRALQRQLGELDTELGRVTGGELAQAKGLIARRRATKAAEELSRAQLEVDAARRNEEGLQRQDGELQARMADFTTRYQAAIDLTADIRRARKRVETISNRMDSFSLESQAPGFVRVVTAARPVERPASGGHRKPLVALGLLAALVALAVPIALDRFNPTIVVPGDVERAIGSPTLGWTAERRDAGTSAAANDQVRRLALSLAREREEHGTSRIAFTAAQAGAGSSTLVLEVARELNRLGVRTVALGANRLHPDPRFAGPVAGPTLVDAMAGEVDIAAAIAPGNAGVPDRVPFGAPADDVVDLSAPPFRAALGRLADLYEMVLVDAAPLLATSDAEVLAKAADAAVLVVPAGRVRPATLQAAARILERLSLAVVGTVLVRVRTDENRRSLGGDLPDSARAPVSPVAARVQRWLWT